MTTKSKLGIGMAAGAGIAACAAIGAGLAAFRRASARARLDLRGKVVLISGGSRGLGLAMAREFGAEGAIIAICSRSEEELARARADLAGRNIVCHTFVCDVTRRDDVFGMVEELERRSPGVDVLVNNAGIIRVGPFTDMGMEDFDKAMNVMFWGPLHLTHAVLPGMQSRQRGNIVNITSIGGKVSIPHLIPYCCAKFAAVALSEGLRPELAPLGIKVTTIVPGLMRTGSHLNAEFKGRYAHEYAWFAAGAATPFVSISARRAARAVVRATMDGRSEKILSFPADALARVHGALPGTVADLLSYVNRVLPDPGNRRGEARPGHDVEAILRSGLWKGLTWLGRRSAEALNEVPRPAV